MTLTVREQKLVRAGFRHPGVGEWVVTQSRPAEHLAAP